MNQYIGQITIIVESGSPAEAERRLRHLAQRLDEAEPDIVFADHNCDIEDAHQAEAECFQSVEQSTLPARFDAYEIAPCRRFEEPGKPGRFYFEPCEPAEADVWTLYGHIPGQGVEAIGDFDTREHAEDTYARITGQAFGQ